MDDVDRAALESEWLLEEAMCRRAAEQAVMGAATGLCADCDEAIPPARLKALPHAARCVSCQEDEEWRRHGK